MTEPQNTATVDWNGARVVRFGALRHILNFWRVRTHVEDGVRVIYYSGRRGMVVLAVEVTHENV